MSYVVVSSAENVRTNNTPLGISINFSRPGVFESLTDIDTQARNNLKNLLLTFPGERYENPTFGCNLKRIIFEQNNLFVKEQIQTLINAAVSNFTPYINIQNLKIITVEDDPTFEHYIKITIIFTVDRSAFEQQITITGTENGQIIVGD
jgi:phage baseplate assembly protein W